jgi:uncharacterized protein YhfF
VKPPAPGNQVAIKAFWLEYQRACGVQVEGFSATAWGRTRPVADELAQLVAAGEKRAHTSLEAEFEAEGDDLPRPGEHLVVLDGAGLPRAIVRTTHVERRYLNEVDDPVAFECGEGDKSLAWWLAAYRQDFAEMAEAQGVQLSERAVLIVEYFERVWPQ